MANMPSMPHSQTAFPTATGGGKGSTAAANSAAGSSRVGVLMAVGAATAVAAMLGSQML
jgi:hypothetical protein